MQLVQHTLQNDQETLAAGIHHPRLFQHGVLVDGVVQGSGALFNGGLEDRFQVSVLPGGSGGPGGGHAGDGEDGALGRLHHRLIGGGHAKVQGHGQVGPVHGGLVPHRLGKAAEQQGQDDAGIAPGSPQQRGGGGVGRLAHPIILLFLHVLCGGPDGQGHVGARVSVRDGEHIQVVDGLLLGIDGGVSVDDRSLKCRRVYRLNHSWHCSFLRMVKTARSPHIRPLWTRPPRWCC